MRVAYLTGRYPTISHTFIVREVRALRALGVNTEAFAIWRSDRQQLTSEVDREEAARTTWLLPLRLRHGLRAVITLTFRPLAALAAIKEARALSRPGSGLRRHVLAVSWVLEAAIILSICRRTGSRHVHAHLSGTATAVAGLVAVLGCAADGEGTWTWSFTVHGPDEFYDVVRESLALKVLRATFVVAISDFARSQLMALVDEEAWSKIHVVHCGVDPALFAPVSRRVSPAGDRLRVLCVGRLTRIKGHGVLIEAARQLSGRGVPIEVTIVGDGAKREDYQQLVVDSGLDDVVRFTGALGQDVIRREFAVADVFCLTSFAEGVPVVLMEAMAMGIPVVASNVMGVPELVHDGVNGRLVAPGRPDLVAAAIEELAHDPAERRRLGAAGRQTVTRRYNVNVQAQLLKELYERFAAGA